MATRTPRIYQRGSAWYADIWSGDHPKIKALKIKTGYAPYARAPVGPLPPPRG